MLLSRALQNAGERLHEREKDHADGGRSHQRARDGQPLCVNGVEQVDHRRGERKKAYRARDADEHRKLDSHRGNGVNSLLVVCRTRSGDRRHKAHRQSDGEHRGHVDNIDDVASQRNITHGSRRVGKADVDQRALDQRGV